MKHFFLVGAALLALGASAHAQQNGRGNRGNNNNGFNNGAGNGNNGGVLPLPEGVEQVVSIDAFNMLLVQTNRDGKSELSPIIVRHIYSGGLARLFGGTTVPTEQFISPGQLRGNGNNSGQNNGGLQINGAQNGGFGGGFQGGAFGGGFGGGVQSGGFGGLQGGVGNAGNFGNGNFGSFQMRRFGQGRN